jgi:hypothetical protein
LPASKLEEIQDKNFTKKVTLRVWKRRWKRKEEKIKFSYSSDSTCTKKNFQNCITFAHNSWILVIVYLLCTNYVTSPEYIWCSIQIIIFRTWIQKSLKSVTYGNIMCIFLKISKFFWPTYKARRGKSHKPRAPKINTTDLSIRAIEKSQHFQRGIW